MRATIEDRGKKAETLTLEAEVAAWRSRRSSRPASIAGKVHVVRIRRRAGPTSCADFSADSPPAVVPR